MLIFINNEQKLLFRFLKVQKSKHGKSFQKTVEFREDMKRIKELSRQIKDERKQENEIKKLRRYLIMDNYNNSNLLGKMV